LSREHWLSVSGRVNNAHRDHDDDLTLRILTPVLGFTI